MSNETLDDFYTLVSLYTKQEIDPYEDDQKEKLVAKIEKALTPPTADEVCEALEEHLEVSVFYDKESCSFYTTTYFEGTKWAQTIIEYHNKGYLQIHGILPPKFVTLIGRFYEGLEE